MHQIACFSLSHTHFLSFFRFEAGAGPIGQAHLELVAILLTQPPQQTALQSIPGFLHPESQQWPQTTGSEFSKLPLPFHC